MKSSGSGRRSRRHLQCLIVDGYNVIARLKRASLSDVEDMDEARDKLIDMLGEYARFTGEDAIVVFDAYATSEAAVEEVRRGVRIVYTSQHETADERIERLVYDLRDTYPQITVATSDYAEQLVTFGGGALRISADEFVRRMLDTERQIQAQVETGKMSSGGQRIGDKISADIANILEKWRRQ